MEKSHNLLGKNVGISYESRALSQVDEQNEKTAID